VTTIFSVTPFKSISYTLHALPTEDSRIKLLYGNQAGAEVGYNPTKPGRPSHTLHTYWISNVRMVLDVEVQGGKSGSAKHSLPRMRHLIDRLAPEERPLWYVVTMPLAMKG